MPAAEAKTGYIVVRPLNYCPDLEEPLHLGNREGEQAPPLAVELIDVLDQPPHSVEQPASDPEQ